MKYLVRDDDGQPVRVFDWRDQAERHLQPGYTIEKIARRRETPAEKFRKALQQCGAARL